MRFKLPKNFDGSRFLMDYNLERGDVAVSDGYILIKRRIEVTEADLLGYVVDIETERQKPITARKKLKESGFLDLEYQNINEFVNQRVTDLATAKTMFKLILLILVSIKDILKE